MWNRSGMLAGPGCRRTRMDLLTKEAVGKLVDRAANPWSSISHGTGGFAEVVLKKLALVVAVTFVTLGRGIDSSVKSDRT